LNRVKTISPHLSTRGLWTLSGLHSCTNITISNKHQRMHTNTNIIKIPLY
jgi:hypothetical protein